MQIALDHGVYRPRVALFGDLLPIDAQVYASFQSSIEAFYAALRQSAAGQRQAMVASALASLQAGAGRAADATYRQSKDAGKSDADANAAARAVVQLYQQQEAAYRKAAIDVAAEEEARQAAAISDKVRQARSLLDSGFGIGPDYPDPKPPGMLTLALVAAGAYFAMKG